MLFETLLDRLREDVRRRVRNGEITERGLARRIGLSQPHTHNVLNGARILTPAIADRILGELGLTIADLIPEEPPRKPVLSVRSRNLKTGTRGF